MDTRILIFLVVLTPVSQCLDTPLCLLVELYFGKVKNKHITLNTYLHEGMLKQVCLLNVKLNKSTLNTYRDDYGSFEERHSTKVFNGM